MDNRLIESPLIAKSAGSLDKCWVLFKAKVLCREDNTFIVYLTEKTSPRKCLRAALHTAHSCQDASAINCVSVACGKVMSLTLNSATAVSSTGLWLKDGQVLKALMAAAALGLALQKV